MKEAIINEWRDIVGAENTRILPDACAVPGEDAVVVSPASTAEVAKVLATANREKIAVFPHSSGLASQQGALCPAGGAVLDLSRMQQVMEIDRENLIATVQPGVPLADLNQRLVEYGLMYPPDPGTVATATCGSVAAAGGGNLRAYKYGEAKHYVMGLEVVLADGRTLAVGGKTVKNVAGYDLTKLFVGSRGTLAVITQLLLKLMPLPETRQCVRAFFKSEQAAAQAALTLVRENMVPSALEILDRATLQALGEFGHGTSPEGTKAALLVEVDGLPAAVKKSMSNVQKLLQSAGATHLEKTETAEQWDKIWSWRRAAWPALAAQQKVACREEAFVPVTAVGPAMQAMQAAADRHQVTVGVFGHAAMGQLHLVLAEGRQKVDATLLRQVVGDVVQGVNALGGFVTGAYVAGPGRQEFLAAQLGSASVDTMRALKAAFDPNGILNPGVLMGV